MNVYVHVQSTDMHDPYRPDTQELQLPGEANKKICVCSIDFLNRYYTCWHIKLCIWRMKLYLRCHYPS
jgi:hypothetical protein